MEPTLDEAALRAIMRGEEGSVEFKSKMPDSREVGEYCVGIGNDGGGWMIVGVSDKEPRQVVGAELRPGDRQRLMETVFDATNIRIEPQTIATSEGNVVAIKIPPRRPGHVLSTKGGKYLIRAGSSLRGMTSDEIAGIFAETAPPSAQDAVQLRLDEVELSFFLQKANAQWAILNLENHSSEDVVIEQFVWKKDGVDLTAPVRCSYLLSAHKQGPLGWKPTIDPITKWELLVPPGAMYPPPFMATIDTVLHCRILDRKRPFPKRMLVQVDVVNRSMREL